MKTWKKILLGVLLCVCITLVILLLLIIARGKRIAKYSTYCMDAIRVELGEYLEKVAQTDFFEYDGAYVYLGSVSYEGADYIFSCSVKGKDNVEINKLEQVYNSEPEEFISYYDNGSIRETGTYIDGIKQGVWTTYDEDGNVIDIQEYRNGKLIIAGEEVYDIADDEKLLMLYPGLQERGWNIILGDTLQTNYVNGTNNLYYDPYRGIAFKVGAEFDRGLIREIDTDENGIPHSEIIFLVKGEENEENRTGINGFREIFTITAVSKQNLENFGVNSNFSDVVIGEKLENFPDPIVGQNNQFIFTDSDPEYLLSDVQIFDVEG